MVEWPASPRQAIGEVEAGIHARMYFVYILISETYLKTYTGITDNPERRLEQHNSGVSTFTKNYVPWQLIFLEPVTDKITARVREKYFKSAAGRRWIKKNLFDEPASTRLASRRSGHQV